MKEEQECIECMRANGQAPLIPTSTQETCRLCGELVWISPESLKLVKEKNLTIICSPCAAALRKKVEVRDLPLTPGQQKELEQARNKRRFFEDDKVP
jgi:hypothetical protein